MIVPLAKGSLYCETLGNGRPMLLMHGGLGQHLVFEHSGHWPFVEENERFLDVVRGWLAQLDPA